MDPSSDTDSSVDLDNETGRFKQHGYEMTSMIIHHGYNSSAGHYFSIIKVQTSKNSSHTRWVKFDDDRISFIEDSDIESWT